MNAEFNWWLLIVGLAVGAGLVWFVVADSRRREEDIEADEEPREALWLSTTLAEDGWDVPPEAVERLLRLQRDYLAAPPPDAVPVPEPEVPAMATSATGPRATTATESDPAAPVNPPRAS